MNSVILEKSAIEPKRLLDTISSYLPELIENSLVVKSSNLRINTELVAILSRNDPDRIAIKVRQETVANCYSNTKLDRQNLPKKMKSGLEIDTIERYINNAIVKIEREVVGELLARFYSPQKLTTIDAMLRFRSGVLSSITFKTEVGGY